MREGKSLRNIPHTGRVKQSPAKEQSLFREIAMRSRETGCARDDLMSLEEGAERQKQSPDKEIYFCITEAKPLFQRCPFRRTLRSPDRSLERGEKEC